MYNFNINVTNLIEEKYDDNNTVATLVAASGMEMVKRSLDAEFEETVMEDIFSAGAKFVIDDSSRWSVGPWGEQWRVTYQATINGSWTTFGVDLVNKDNFRNVLRIIHHRAQTGFRADAVRFNTPIQGHDPESYMYSGTGIFSIGKLMLNLTDRDFFLWSNLQMLYQVASFYSLYSDIDKDEDIKLFRDKCVMISDGLLNIPEQNERALVEGYQLAMLRYFFGKGVYIQFPESGRLMVSRNTGSYRFNQKNATVDTFDITYLSADFIGGEDGEPVEFIWNCNNTEYVPVQKPYLALEILRRRFEHVEPFHSTSMSMSLEDIHAVQVKHREATNWEKEK